MVSQLTLREGELVDLKHRQNVFHPIVEPTLHDLEFDADVLARWYPFGMSRKSIVIDPGRSFGRPVVSDGGASNGSQRLIRTAAGRR